MNQQHVESVNGPMSTLYFHPVFEDKYGRAERDAGCNTVHTAQLDFDENWGDYAPRRCAVTFGVPQRSIMGQNEVTYVTLIGQQILMA